MNEGQAWSGKGGAQTRSEEVRLGRGTERGVLARVLQRCRANGWGGVWDLVLTKTPPCLSGAQNLVETQVTESENTGAGPGRPLVYPPEYEKQVFILLKGISRKCVKS